MKNQIAVSHQDGGVFAKGSKPAKKGVANKKNNGKQNEPKAAKVRANNITSLVGLSYELFVISVNLELELTVYLLNR